MNSARERSAAAAFGGSGDLPVEPEEGYRRSVEDGPDNDVQPDSKLISKIQSVELLEKLIQFMPQEYSQGSAVAQSNAVSAQNRDIGDIKIMSQFKLRYLCRRFRNLIHTGTPLTVNLVSSSNVDGGMPRAYIADASCVRLSRCRSNDQFSGLVNSSLTVSTELLRLQCDASSRILAFPSITLEKLDLRFDSFAASEIDCVAANRDCLKHLLSCSSESLTELSVDFSVLSSALAARNDVAGQNNVGENAANVRVASLPADWSWDGLRTLKLRDKFDLLEDVDYDYQDANLRAAAHVEFANLRRWFPNITKLSFAADRPQIDFAVLNEFTELRKFSLNTHATGDELRADCNLVPLTNIQSFRLESVARFPLHFSIVLPHLKKFRGAPRYARALTDLADEIEMVGGTFQLLQTFVIEQPRNVFHASTPLFQDLVRLILSLGRLPSLVRLKVRCVEPDLENFDLWCPAGDLSLVQVLPRTVTHVAFQYALCPSYATRDRQTNPPWSLRCSYLVPLTGEYIYKEWLRALLFLIVDHPALEHFYCLCVAPQFEAIFALAEKWNRSSTAAIADLGLTSVVHIQCKPAYTRMLETEIPSPGDRFMFRFVLSPPAQLASTAGSSTKRKFVTVEFHNPN